MNSIVENHPGQLGYVRTSSSEGTLDLQLKALNAIGIEKSDIYIDHISSQSSTRPELTKAIELAQQSNRQLVVHRLDRLGRSLLGILDTMRLLSEKNVRLISLDEGLDFATPEGQKMTQVASKLVGYERDLIQERTTAGLRRARRNGDNSGRPVSMTKDRIEKTTKMLANGSHVINEILPALQDMEGPSIKKAALYRWIKDHKVLAVPAASTDDK